jgi:hypothetical protein
VNFGLIGGQASPVILLSATARRMSSSAIREILKGTRQQEVLAGLHREPDLGPLRDRTRAASTRTRAGWPTSGPPGWTHGSLVRRVRRDFFLDALAQAVP